MFKQKNALIAIAVAMLVAACGGGGGDDPPANNNPPAQNPGGNNPPGNGNPVDTVPMVGFLTMTANQVAFNGSTKLIGLDAFKAVAPETGAYDIAKGTNAPFKTFGIRVYPGFMGPNQTKVVRVAIDATDTVGGAAAQSFKLLIDQVEIAVGATPDALTVTVPATAKAYVYARTATGTTVNAVSATPLPVDLVTLANTIPGDSDSRLLDINVDAAVASAKGASTDPVFIALPDFKGRFTFNATISNVELRRGDGTTVEQGASIDVTGSGQPAVTGGGVQGFAWFNDDGIRPTTP